LAFCKFKNNFFSIFEDGIKDWQIAEEIMNVLSVLLPFAANRKKSVASSNRSFLVLSYSRYSISSLADLNEIMFEWWRIMRNECYNDWYSMAMTNQNEEITLLRLNPVLILDPFNSHQWVRINSICSIKAQDSRKQIHLHLIRYSFFKTMSYMTYSMSDAIAYYLINPE
jgi:hypothetical protein